jgi:hypothetical protein
MPKKDKKKTAAHKERVAQKVSSLVMIANENRQHQSKPGKRLKTAKSAAAITTTKMRIWTSTASWNSTNERYPQRVGRS